MIASIWFGLAVLASPFKSKSRLEADNAVLRHQLIVLQRRVRGRAQADAVWKSLSAVCGRLSAHSLIGPRGFEAAPAPLQGGCVGVDR
jgi:hypothetical protein